jgi:LysR family transcriptional regulator, glycine cleavage system transcriptional activator
VRDSTAGALAERLFGERVLPVASPKLVPRAMREAGEILRYPLLHYEDPQFDWPWLSWRVWCEAARVDFAATRSAAHYSHYDQVIAAAVAGQGIALGRTGLVDEWLHDGRLVAPLGKRYAADLSRERAYYLVVNPRARDRAPVVAFRAWLATQIPKGEGSP